MKKRDRLSFFFVVPFYNSFLDRCIFLPQKSLKGCFLRLFCAHFQFFQFFQFFQLAVSSFN